MIITYNESDTDIIFKGMIQSYSLSFKNYDYYLTIEGISYSSLLEGCYNNRIYQNEGTTYEEVLERVMEDNEEFYTIFGEDEVGETPLVSDEYPLVLQYKESEWDFIKRLASYLNQPLVIDDTKDEEESIGILLGYHNSTSKEAFNVTGIKESSRDKDGHKKVSYKIIGIDYFEEEDIFQIGKRANYRFNAKSEGSEELILIKNKLYLDKGRLVSDLTLVKEDSINVKKRKRKLDIAGRSFRAKVKDVGDNHKAKVKFIDIDDDFKKGKASSFPSISPIPKATLLLKLAM